MIKVVCFIFLALVLIDIGYSGPAPRMKVLPCPRGSRPLYRPDNQPRKCLPHQTNLCLNALDDRTDPSTVCCWHNQIDYHCCIGIDVAECPQYNNVTVVIHNSFSHLASPVKSFHFRKGIEDEIEFSQ